MSTYGSWRKKNADVHETLVNIANLMDKISRISSTTNDGLDEIKNTLIRTQMFLKKIGNTEIELENSINDSLRTIESLKSFYTD